MLVPQNFKLQQKLSASNLEQYSSESTNKNAEGGGPISMNAS